MNERKMGGAMEHWLGFQDNIGRSFMLNEDALKYPLADYLVNAGGMQIDAIELQRQLPGFPSRHMDLAIVDLESETQPKQIINSFELKLAKNETRGLNEKKRIFNDLIRLHHSKQFASGKCYFIITGKTANFIDDFRLLAKDFSVKDGPMFYEKWFAFDEHQVATFNVRAEADNLYKTIYDSFAIEYGSTANGNFTPYPLPEAITTTCEFITPTDPTGLVPYMAGIWSIQ